MLCSSNTPAYQCGSESGRQAKNGGADCRGWSEREFHEEAGEESG